MSRQKKTERQHLSTSEGDLSTDGAADVGQVYSLVIERHASKPFWRLRESITNAKGDVKHTVTKWERFPEFSPDFNMCHGRLRHFLFGGDTRMPLDLVKS